MPRKKKTEETISQSAVPIEAPASPEALETSPAPPQEEAPAAAPRRRKAVSLPSESQAEAEAPAPARRRAKAPASPEAPAPAEEAPKGRRRAKALPSEEAPAAAAAPPEAAPAKGRRRAKALPSEAEPVQAEAPAAPVEAPAPRRTRRTKAEEAAPVPAEAPEAEFAEKVVLDLEDLASPLEVRHSFRQRKPLPAVLGEEAPEEPVEDEEEADSFAPSPLTFTLRTRAGAPARAPKTPEAPAAKAPEAPRQQAPAPAEEPEREEVELPVPPPRILADDEERNLIVALWRQKGDGPPPVSSPEPEDLAPQEDQDDETAPSFGRRRRRRRGRRDEKDDQVEAGAEAEAPQEAPAPAAAPAAKEEAPPVPPAVAQVPETKVTRQRIVVPTDAPQVVLRQGVPTLVVDRKVVPPLIFSVGRLDARSEALVLEQAKMAAEQGVTLFGVTVKLEPSEEGVDAARFAIQSFALLAAQASSEAKVVVRVEFAQLPVPSHRGWVQDEGSPSLASDSYWAEAAEALGSLCRAVKDLPVLGVHVDRSSWHFAENEGYEDSPESRAKFGEWLRHRYRNDVISLRASWFDGRVEFGRVQIPDFRNRHGSATDFVRLDRRARRWVDYHLFLSDLAVERIMDLARSVKEASQGRFLVGVSYGYTFEWSHPGSGHLSLGKLLRSPEVDYVAGPPSYKSREPGASGAPPWPIDSFALNGKLALSEEDFRTSIGRGDGPSENPLMRTPQALESAHWRGVGAVLAHGGGLNWMDAESQGWLGSRGIWERAQRVSSALNWRAATALKDPDVALLIDERSLAYLSDERAFIELVQDVREAALRSGLSVGFYLLSDLAHRETFPEARVHIFVNAWDIRPEVRSAIKSRLQRDNKVLLWLYSAGLFEGGRESLVRAREVTGIALRPQPFNSKSGTTLLNVRDPLCRVLPEEAIAQGGSLEPSYFAIPEDAVVLGEYAQTGLPSFVLQKFPKQGTSEEPWTSVFLGEPVVSPGLIRALGEMAGAHAWCLDDDVLHVRPPFLTIHCRGAGVRTLTLPDKWSCYDLIQGVWMPVENSNLKFLGLDGATHCFLVGHKSEIEAILASPGSITLSEEEIKAHQDNTIQWDSIKFDVPIMKLDEWVEESWGEDLAEDLLIKPSMYDEVEAAPEEPAESPADRPQRSRGRRERGRRDKGRRGRTDPGQKAQEEVQTINFLFRKRE